MEPKDKQEQDELEVKVDVGGKDEYKQLSFREEEDGKLHLVDQEQVKRWPDSWFGLLS